MSCLQQFKNVDNIAYVIQDAQCDNAFCSVACLNNFMMSNSKQVECYGCKNTGGYYQMIRSSYQLGIRAWCSVECSTQQKFTSNLKAIVEATSTAIEQAHLG